MRYLTRLAVLAIIGLPMITSAATAAELQAQAEALLQQVAALQSQLGTQGGTTASGTGTVSSANCPLIGRVLKRGSSGDDVSRLQKFLATDPAIYPEAQITGYYGVLTEAAVKRWQTKFNIVSSGTAESTGFGVTGPRTAAAISLQCSTYGASGGASPTVGGFIQVSPISGNAPLPVNVTATVNTLSSCGSAVYLLEWGDGSTPQSIPVSAGACAQMAQTYQHTYIYGGVYIVKLSAGGHESTATVVVSGPSAPSTNAVNLPASLSASPNSGASPLSTTFTAYGAGAAYPGGVKIIYGDGSQATLCNPGVVCGQSSLAHTYTAAGTYSASIVGFGSNTNTTLATTQVTVTAGTGSGTGSTTYQPFALTPSVNGNPLVAAIQFEYTVCDGYNLNWGDGSIDNQIASTPCSSTKSTKTINHTYSSGSNYTVTLKRGSQTDTASITISN